MFACLLQKVLRIYRIYLSCYCYCLHASIPPACIVTGLVTGELRLIRTALGKLEV